MVLKRRTQDRNSDDSTGNQLPYPMKALRVGLKVAARVHLLEDSIPSQKMCHLGIAFGGGGVGF
jgi:hypothetical protein